MIRQTLYFPSVSLHTKRVVILPCFQRDGKASVTTAVSMMTIKSYAVAGAVYVIKVVLLVFLDAQRVLFV